MNRAQSRRKVILGAAALLALGAVWAGLEARESGRAAWTRAWTLEAEELGSFTRSALARGADLQVVERFSALSRRDDFAYALVMDRSGRARLHSDVASTGRVYDSDFAKRAAAAGATLVQPVPGAGLVEVDVPLGASGVLRAGFSLKAVRAEESWWWAGLLLALAGLAASALPALRGADKL